MADAYANDLLDGCAYPLTPAISAIDRNSGNLLIYSDGAKRRSGAASSAWVIYNYRHNGGGKHTPHILVRDGFCIQDDQTTAFGAEVLALEGAVKAAIGLVFEA